MDKAGKKALINLFNKSNPHRVNVPFTTEGLKLSKKIIHIVAAEMSSFPNFKNAIFIAYDKIIRCAIDLKVDTLVFPPIPYSYKRLGGMNTYKTARTLIKYFYNKYNPDYTILILQNNQGFIDFINNYSPNYVSTSFPVSKRHRPLDYPFVDDKYLNDFLINGDYYVFNNYISKRNYKLVNIKENKVKLYEQIKEKFKDDASFCFASNIDKKAYINYFEGDYCFNKQEAIGICLAMRYSLDETRKFLANFNYSLKEDDPYDQQIISYINNKEYDVFSINEKLYYQGFKQIGSNK